MKKKALSALNAMISKAQSSQKTYKASKTNYFAKTGESLSRDLFQKGLKHRLITEGQKVSVADAVSKTVRADLDMSIKAMKKDRKNITFRRIGGRVIPIRAKK